MSKNGKLAKKLKDARERAGVSQQALSDRLGISRRTIGYYETGARKIPGVVMLDWLRECALAGKEK